jgi:hypothetical protein
LNAEMTIDGPKDFKDRRVCIQLRSRAIADFFDGEGERTSTADVKVFCAVVNLFDGILDRAMERDFETKEFVGTGGAKVNGSGSALGNGVDTGAAGNGSEVEGCARFFRERGTRHRCESCGQCGDGVRRAGVSEAVSAGAVDRDLKAEAAESLGNGGVGTRTIEHDVSGDASGESALLVEVANSTQVALTLFPHIAQDDDGDREFYLGVDDGLCESEHADDAGGVVAGSGSGQLIGSVVAGDPGIEERSRGKNGVEVRGEDHDGSGAVGGKMGSRDESDDIAEFVNVDVGEADFSETGGEPAGASFLSEGRGGDGDEFSLAIDEGFGIVMHPRECGMYRSLRGDGRYASEGRAV